MCALLLLSATCRVCLASDREMYRLTNTPLEETYERVTSGTLVVEGRPCCVCGVCLSALRRCRRFIDTAREANDALDLWIRNTPNTDMLKLTERPLFSFTRSSTEVFEATWREQEGIYELGVKQESDTAAEKKHEITYQEIKITSDDRGNVLTEEIKYEVTSDDENDNTNVSDDEADETAMSDIIKNNSSQIQVEMIDCDVIKDNLSPSTSNVERNHPSAHQDEVSLRRLRSGKSIKVNEDTRSGPALKKRKPIKSEDQPGNTDTVAAPCNEINMFSCNYCHFQTTKKGILTLHLKKHTAKQQYACDKCDYKNYHQTQFINHLRVHTGEKPFACDKCDYKASNKANFQRHLLTHNIEKSFVCNYCDYKTHNKYHLKNHLLSHSGNKRFSCDKCDYRSDFNHLLQRHLMTHIRTEERPFLCDKCNYRCNFIGSLRKHLTKHSDAKPFACDKCDYKCRDKTFLKWHLITHSDKKPFACDKCDFKSSRKRNVKLHLMTHTGEKPWACDKCDFKCLAKNSLRRHLRIHTGEKPFVCDKCDYKCSERGHLKTHLRTHTGEKPFACDKCDYKCTNINTLGKHMTKVHDRNIT